MAQPASDKVKAMSRLLWALLLIAQAPAQSSKDAVELLQRTEAFGEQTKYWRAKITQTSKMSLPGIKLKDEVVLTKIATQPSLGMSRINSGDDRTIMVCDGTNFWYSGDAHSYYKYEATQQCNSPLLTIYETPIKELLEPSSRITSLSITGEDHVHLTDGDRRCVVIRAELMRGPVHIVRTLCVDPIRPMILRDRVEAENQERGIKSSTVTTFISFELNPNISPDTFRFVIPPDAVEAHPPTIEVHPPSKN